MSFDSIYSVVYEVASTILDSDADADLVALGVEKALHVIPTTLVLTMAPEAYDYGYTEHIGWSSNLYPENLRLVRIPTAQLAYQVGRYQSGSYGAFEVIP